VKAMQVNNAKAVGEAAREPDMAVAVGAWESEGLHIFLNADHTHTPEKRSRSYAMCSLLTGASGGGSIDWN
jgi:hypothetical protein